MMAHTVPVKMNSTITDHLCDSYIKTEDDQKKDGGYFQSFHEQKLNY
jgi:hypothetical protein